MFHFLNLRTFQLPLLVFISINGFCSSHHFEPTYNSHNCSVPCNNTANSPLDSSLNSLLNSLSKASADSFYTETFNGIFGLVLCRGDVSSDNCHSCVTTATKEVKARCPSTINATIWYDECMLRYSDKKFFGTVEMSPSFVMASNTSSEDPNIGIVLLSQLVNETAESKMMFMAKRWDESGTRYGLAQCTRDINNGDCSMCLNALLQQNKQWYKGKIGWRILGPNCNLRYEQYLFYQQQLEGGNRIMTIVVIAISAVAAVVLLSLLSYLFLRRKRKREMNLNKSGEILLQNLGGFKSSHWMEQDTNTKSLDGDGEMNFFSFGILQVATNNFADANRLGEGGFGPVYKGKLLNGKEIAVKRLSVKSNQGHDEFKNEVMVILKLQHKNLVRLLGCCLEGEEKLLVYEYMANTSLDAFLFDPIKCKQLDWHKRNNIINGISRGLLYLHEDSRLKIIHRDLKASNILLDDEMNAKISDFGTARIFGGKQIEASTNRVVGTYGYMAPEYAMEGVFSIKSDVYSFGILMLEVISGRKNIGFFKVDTAQSLLSQAWKLWNEGRAEEMIDPNLLGDCPLREVVRWIHIALLCVQEDPNIRPTMSMVVLMLGSNLIHLTYPSKPPFFPIGFPTFNQSNQTTTGVESGYLNTDQSSTTVSI